MTKTLQWFPVPPLLNKGRGGVRPTLESRVSCILYLRGCGLTNPGDCKVGPKLIRLILSLRVCSLSKHDFIRLPIPSSRLVISSSDILQKKVTFTVKVFR